MMKRPLFFGFTLIELLVVMSIITVLAGLTISTVKYAQNKAARDRAKAEISALELALESYKVDNGDYPRDNNTDGIQTTTLTAASVKIDGINATPPAVSGSASMTLYAALSGDTNFDRKVDTDPSTNAKYRVYFPFKPSMLYPKNDTTKVTAIVDPFGNVYGYSTIGSGTSTTSGTLGFNPTFDLWCSVDPGHTGTTGTMTWITNW